MSTCCLLIQGLTGGGIEHHLETGVGVDTGKNLVDGGDQFAALGKTNGDGGVSLGSDKALAIGELDVGQIGLAVVSATAPGSSAT